nr:alanine racemase [Thiohalomonas denitrificans]
MGRATRVTIDLGALRHNLSIARITAPRAKVMAAIKANGYGHGLERVATALQGADALGVACINEALALRTAGIEAPITLLEGFFRADEIPLLRAYRFEAVLHEASQVDALERSHFPGPVRVWIKVDTGMHRLGFAPGATRGTWRRLNALEGVEVVGFMTHLACADDRSHPATLRQLALFEESVEGLPGERAIANSAGVLGWPETHAEWIRPGVMLYGISPFLEGRGPETKLRPAMTLHSELIAVNHISKGEFVGYGGTWRAPEALPVGVVAIGYGDGYPRHAPSGTPVLVNGKQVPLIGRVSMDMITVDLRGQPQARVGDPVVLWGEGLPAEVIAERAGTIAYELLCGVTQRVRCEEVGADG